MVLIACARAVHHCVRPNAQYKTPKHSLRRYKVGANNVPAREILDADGNTYGAIWKANGTWIADPQYSDVVMIPCKSRADAIATVRRLGKTRDSYWRLHHGS